MSPPFFLSLILTESEVTLRLAFGLVFTDFDNVVSFCSSVGSLGFFSAQKLKRKINVRIMNELVLQKLGSFEPP